MSHTLTQNASRTSRPVFPRRCIVTAGMPYGSKDLHFGHIGGVFVHADAFARFMRDRIGAENVIFISGTDCYGSPAVVEHQKQVERGEFRGSLEEFVQFNHERQRASLAAYHISLDIFPASSFGRAKEIHQEMGACFARTLHSNGYLEKRTTKQFYDAGAGAWLNGRQVLGQCPVQGCRAETAYADECSLGHQYDSSELTGPRSSLTGSQPELRDVTNWYLDVGALRKPLEQLVGESQVEGRWRDFVLAAVREFLRAPTVYVTQGQADRVAHIKDELPPHVERADPSKSLELQFNHLTDRELALTVLAKHSIRYRTGKTLVPFRLTGNLTWGLPAPEIDGLDGLTFWVWPESLWAPISFTAHHLERTSGVRDAWREWWCSPESQVYQFIGEDNIYFYGVAEPAMFLGTQGREVAVKVPDGHLGIPVVVANRHLLFLDKKASSSGQQKPPLASELLRFYSVDQLRVHFLSMALGKRNVSFRPKPFDPDAAGSAPDPVLKDGNLLSNSLNRSVRSCFYTAQKFYECRVPIGDVSADIVEMSRDVILRFESAMFEQDFPAAIAVAAAYIHETNARWTQAKPFSDSCEPNLRRQTLIDAFHMVRVAVVMLHPIAPVGCERVREYLNVGPEFWSWDHIEKPIYSFMPDPNTHQCKPLPPKTDFFEKVLAPS